MSQVGSAACSDVFTSPTRQHSKGLNSVDGLCFIVALPRFLRTVFQQCLARLTPDSLPALPPQSDRTSSHNFSLKVRVGLQAPQARSALQSPAHPPSTSKEKTTAGAGLGGRHGPCILQRRARKWIRSPQNTPRMPGTQRTTTWSRGLAGFPTSLSASGMAASRCWRNSCRGLGVHTGFSLLSRDFLQFRTLHATMS